MRLFGVTFSIFCMTVPNYDKPVKTHSSSIYIYAIHWSLSHPTLVRIRKCVALEMLECIAKFSFVYRDYVDRDNPGLYRFLWDIYTKIVWFQYTNAVYGVIHIWLLVSMGRYTYGYWCPWGDPHMAIGV